jgi:hypothetical protein
MRTDTMSTSLWSERTPGVPARLSRAVIAWERGEVSSAGELRAAVTQYVDLLRRTGHPKAEINALLEDIARRTNRFHNKPMLSTDDIAMLIHEVVGGWNGDEQTEQRP